MDTTAPFFYYSKSFPRILNKLKATLAYSTYQAGKVILISSQNGESITKYAKNFNRPMGIAFTEDASQLAVSSKTTVELFSSNPTLAASFPDQKKRYSHLYIPQLKFHTGLIDTHEIFWVKDEVYITNTLFSSISKMSSQFHFEEYWRPDFISELVPEDRCHLNGVAVVDGNPKYATMFAMSNEPKGWRSQDYQSGILLDIETGESLCTGLALPHSPVFADNKLYFLLSGTGGVMEFDLVTKKLQQLASYKTFLRGLDVIGDFLFLGMSTIRENSQFFSDLPIKSKESYCGIRIINRHTGKEVGGLTYTDKIKEIFAVKVAKNVVSPAILTESEDIASKCLNIPDGSNYWLEFEKK